jgi:hypothetical protein
MHTHSRPRPTQHHPLAALLHGLLLCAALANVASCAAVAQPAALSTDKVTHTLQPSPAGRPAFSRQEQLESVGYAEEEWRLSGQAQTYSADGDWGDDGHWKIKTRGAPVPYETRVLVRRPKDPAKFNGIVLVEWMNTSLGFEIDGGWISTRDEIEREGYAWVGVSAEEASVKALKKAKPERYAQAFVNDSDYSFDIYDHAAVAIRQAAGQWGSPGTQVKLLGMGYSKSASFLFTFINAFQPISHAYDGFYMRGATPAAIQVNGWHINKVMPKVRADSQVPLMQVQTEMEVAVSWPLSKTQDTDKLRYWEVAGATHLDQTMQDETMVSSQADAQLKKPKCVNPSSTLPAQRFDHAALHALRTWVTVGTPPPKAPRLQRTGIGFVKDDELGNAVGGLRLPELDVPIARYGMFNNAPTNSLSFWVGFACFAGGSTKPLPADTLRARYPSDQAYLQAYKQASDKLLNEGFLRPFDHAQMLKAAESIKLPH